MKKVIIALHPIEKGIPNYNELIESFEIVNYSLTTPEKFEIDMKLKPYNEAVAIFGSYPGFKPFNGLIDHKIIDSLPSNLEIIGLCSAGFDGYDLSYLKLKNIKLCNVPVNKLIAMDVADCALWHVLSGIRKFNSWDKYIKNDSLNNSNDNNNSHTLKIRDIVRNNYVIDSEKEKGFAFGHIYHGTSTRSSLTKKCLILGYGLIGKSVVDRMSVLGMEINVLVRDKSKYNDSRVNFYSSKLDSDILKASSGIDVIIICLPGGSETYHCVNKKILDNLNENSIIVNIGRGSCIDVEALRTAIESGKVSHVGLDVFDKEPVIENYYLDESYINENSNKFFTSTITPHLGSSTLDTLECATYECIKNIINGLNTGEYSNIVNT